MHKNWILNYLDNKSLSMAAKSLLNCHVKGVDSIMFDDTPGQRIRLYIANDGHELWRNHPSANDQSVAYHPHHCDITIECVKGQFDNIILISSPDGQILDEWHYKSKITQGECAFSKTGDTRRFAQAKKVFNEGDSEFLPATVMHTMHVRKDCRAAWFVYEGRENERYEPLCYTNADLTKFDASGLYLPMSGDYMMAKVREVFNL